MKKAGSFANSPDVRRRSQGWTALEFVPCIKEEISAVVTPGSTTLHRRILPMRKNHMRTFACGRDLPNRTCVLVQYIPFEAYPAAVDRPSGSPCPHGRIRVW